MRSLLRSYADRGCKAPLSSHLLHEIEVIADEIIVIGDGRIVAQGTKAELLQNAGTYVRAGDPSALAQALTSAGITSTPVGEGLNVRRHPSRSARLPHPPGSRFWSCVLPTAPD